VTDGTATFTYADILRRTCALAERLQANTACGSLVGICLSHGATFPIAALACLACGRPYVPIDLKVPPSRMRAIAVEAGMTAVIGNEATIPQELRDEPIAFLDFGKASEGSGLVRPIPSDVNDAAVILHTSGSTGKPKGLCNSQSAILQRVYEYTNSCHLHAGDRIMLLSSPSTIAGVRETFAALVNRASLYITHTQRAGIGDVLRAFTKGRITVCYTVPALLRALVRAPCAGLAFSDLRVLPIGGNITLVSDLALFRAVAPATCHFFVSFSATECPAVFQWFVPANWEGGGTRIPVGYARPGVEFAVTDNGGKSVSASEIGELVVKSRYVALGQWQDGRLINGSFRTDPDDPSKRIIHLGDLVEQRSDGLWDLIGRTDRQLKIRGQRVDLAEVESTLRSCAWVSDTAVIVRRTDETNCAIVAFVSLRIEDKDAFITHGEILAEIKRMFERNTPSYARPTEIRIIGRISQLPGFKPDIRLLEALDRRALEASILGRSEQNEIPGPTISRAENARATECHVRDAVKRSWSAVIGTRSFDPDHSREDSEGDSLKAIELWFYLLRWSGGHRSRTSIN
jgi:acyl-coenzyme A synthetase/AMP-(fatty) acid ligase